MDRIQISYANGIGTLTIPGKAAKKKDLVLKLTMAEADALCSALAFTALWPGDGYMLYDWPAAEKRKRNKRNKKA